MKVYINIPCPQNWPGVPKRSVHQRWADSFCILPAGLEGSGSEWRAGGTSEPRPGSPTGEESRTGHHIGAKSAPLGFKLVCYVLLHCGPLRWARSLFFVFCSSSPNQTRLWLGFDPVFISLIPFNFFLNNPGYYTDTSRERPDEKQKIKSVQERNYEYE